MKNTQENPLISFAILAYNQEEFIGDAIEGAFAQTYSPLEIIISDDHSTDNTYEIIKEVANRYSGIHQIVINRNEKNLGIGAHVNRVMDISTGEIIVAAAGDDMSLPERTAIIEKCFRYNKNTMLAFSDFQFMDKNGILGDISSRKMEYNFNDPVELCKHYFRNASGASCAWHRDIYRIFGQMMSDVTFEDSVHFFRAALIGKIEYIPKSLVQYRRHDNNICTMFRTGRIEDQQKQNTCTKIMMENNIRDLITYENRENHDDQIVCKCRSVIKRKKRLIEARLNILSGNLGEMVFGFFKLTINGGHPLRGFRLALKVFYEMKAN